MGAPAPRRFVALTSREALRLARRSLGSEAMVLASRAIADGFEVVAMAERDAAALAQAAAADAVNATGPAATALVPADTVLTELHSMRTMIEERLASLAWNDQQKRDPLRGRLLRTLLGAGFSARLSRAVLEQLPAGKSYAQGLAFVRSELTRALPVQENEDALLEAGGAYALVGPTGVGKTTTTAKLAARCVMRFGAGKLALVTTDGYRIGAHEQLRIYGNILGVPVYAVKDRANLQSVLGQLRDRHMVLIDTVGMSQRDRAVSDQIAMLCNVGLPVKRLLLLNAASHGDTLNEVVYAYQHAGNGNQLAGCIFTKLDEAVTHGALLDTAIRHRLPVHYLSSGQKVPEDLIAASPAQLIEDVLKAPALGTLFTFDPDLGGEASHRAPDAGASARAGEDERLRLQYHQLIRAMDHDAGEIATAARFLRELDVGFDFARALWTSAFDENVRQATTSQQVLEFARASAPTACDSHILALSGPVRLDGHENGEAAGVEGGVLLSDADGLPFAAPDQWLTADGEAAHGLRQLAITQQHQLGLPVVHLLPRLPATDELARWAEQGRLWMSRASGATLVAEPGCASSIPLWRVPMEFGAPEPMTYRGRNALRAEAESQVRLHCPRGGELTLRCVRRRIVDADSRRPLEQLFLLSNAAAHVTTRQLTHWHEWGARAESCLRLIGTGVSLLGGIGEPGTAVPARRLLIAGQVATTAWRVLRAAGGQGERTRALLAELAGRQGRTDRRQPGNAVFEGLVKLFHLLDALACESADDPAPGSSA